MRETKIYCDLCGIFIYNKKYKRDFKKELTSKMMIPRRTKRHKSNIYTELLGSLDVCNKCKERVNDIENNFQQEMKIENSKIEKLENKYQGEFINIVSK